MKLIFESLDAMLAELRDRHVQVVRVAPAIQSETGRRTTGIPHFISRIVVTAGLDEHLWAEWRLWVGRAMAEVGLRGLVLPDRLRRRGDELLAAVRERVETNGFEVRDGLLVHDTVAIDTFRFDADAANPWTT